MSCSLETKYHRKKTAEVEMISIPVWIKTVTSSKLWRGVEMMENLNFSISARTRSSRVASLTRLVLNKVVFVFDMDSKAVEIYSPEN